MLYQKFDIDHCNIKDMQDGSFPSDGNYRKLAFPPAVRLIGSDYFVNKDPNCWGATIRCLARISRRHCY